MSDDDAPHGFHDDEKWIVGWLANGDVKLTDEQFEHYRDQIVPFWLLTGDKPPVWGDIEYEPCPGGCHTEAYLPDTANGTRYFISATPRGIALGGLMIVPIEPNATPEEIAETIKGQADHPTLPEDFIKVRKRLMRGSLN